MADNTLTQSTDLLSGPLQQLIDMGGPVIMVLLVLAAAGVVTFVYLMLCGAVYAPRLPRSLRRVIDDWHHSPSQACADRVMAGIGWFQRQNPLRRLTADTMAARLNHDEPNIVRETLARDARAALEPFEGPLKILEVIAALAPLLGLLGTVLGMMDAFSAMAATEGRADASQLSGGIYEALTTTAAGLIVAIPFAALAAWVEFRLRRLNNLVNGALVTVLAPAIPEQPTAIDMPAAAEEVERQPEAPARQKPAARQDTSTATASARVAHAAG